MAANAVLAAVLGTLASVAGKCAFEDSLRESLGITWQHAWIVQAAIGVGAMIALNGVMWTTLVKAMQKTGTVTATATSNAVSFALSGLLGALFFGDTLTQKWFLGTALTIGGVTMLTLDKTDESETARKDQKDTRSQSKKNK
ncbi:MAG: hypothetical protein MHM6MM_008454 [Cercozoa sp. M6MM]